MTSSVESNLMRQDHLRLNEELIIQARCQYWYKKGKQQRQVDGVLFITNCALRFKESSCTDQQQYQLVYNRLKLTGVVSIEDDKDKNLKGCSIKLFRDPKKNEKVRCLDFVHSGAAWAEATKKIEQELAKEKHGRELS